MKHCCGWLETVKGFFGLLQQTSIGFLMPLEEKATKNLLNILHRCCLFRKQVVGMDLFIYTEFFRSDLILLP
ncbi:hypothetical protein A1354_00625 [Pseudomonas asplenii]|nr:hypothetical protein A1354_00625 [Pseudomonas asplenii]